MRGLMADAQRFGRAKNFSFPELYELIECGQVVPRPDADERKPETDSELLRSWCDQLDVWPNLGTQPEPKSTLKLFAGHHASSQQKCGTGRTSVCGNWTCDNCTFSRSAFSHQFYSTAICCHCDCSRSDDPAWRRISHDHAANFHRLRQDVD